MTHQLSRRLAAVIGAVSIVLVSLIAAVPATAATSVDLTTQLTVPPEGTPGGPFSMTATVRNVGIDAANGSSFRVQLERGTKNVAATCATSAGGANCATNIVVAPGDATTGPVVTGDLPTLPRNGSVTITVTGTFPSTSSATTVLTAIVPAGAVDSSPGTNTVSQSTALSGTANLIVTKTQDKDSVAVGETRTYTVSYRNDGPNDLIGIYVYDIAYGPALASGTHDFSVTCATTNSAPCPEWVTGAPQSSPTAYGSMPYAGNATIPAGTTLALTVPWTVNSTACVPGGVYAIDNYAYRATTLPGMNLTGNTSAFAAGTITGPACPETHLVVSKAQDKQTVGLGETRTYTVSYRNEGPADISDINVSDVFYGPSLPEGSQNYSVTCADASSAPCPAWANGETQTANSSGAQSVFNGSVNLPAGSELVLTIPWTINGTACIPGGFYDAENNAYRSMNPTGVNVTGDSTSRVTGIVTGTACAEANVTVEKTQDKTTVALDEIRTYTVTYRNNGPADATALNLYDVLYGSDLPDGSHNYSVNCAESSTAPCPDWADGESHSSTGTAISPLRGNADIPAGTSLVLTVPWTVTSTSCIPGGVYNAENNAYRSSSVPGVTMTGNVTATVTGTVTCVDVSSVTKFSTSEPAPRAPLAVSTTVSNAQGTAHDIPVTVTLPRAGFIVPDAGAADLVTCAPTDSDACPTDLRYDAETHTMLGTIPTLAGGQGVTLTINGTSGVIPPTTDSYIATTTAPAIGQGDPSPQSNNSEDSFGISNEQTTVTVTQRLDRPAPTALTFTGEVTCTLQDAVPFTLVVPAGATEATSVVTDKLWLHDDCTVTVTHPEAPAHYSWGEWNPSNASTHTAVSGPLTDTFAVSLMLLTQEVAVPATPAVTDPCGPGNAVYQTQANTDVFTWTSNADRTLTVTLSEGYVFPDGTTSHTYPAPVDSGVDCPVTGSPEPSTPIDPTTNPPVDPSTEPHVDPGTKPQPSTPATDALASTGTSPAAGWVVTALFLLTAGCVLTALRRRART